MTIHRQLLLAMAGLLTLGPATARAVGADGGADLTATACTWSPAADHLSFGPHLVGTVRTSGGEVQVLHRVTCSDGIQQWLWMPSDYRGA